MKKGKLGLVLLSLVGVLFVIFSLSVVSALYECTYTFWYKHTGGNVITLDNGNPSPACPCNVDNRHIRDCGRPSQDPTITEYVDSCPWGYKSRPDTRKVCTDGYHLGDGTDMANVYYLSGELLLPSCSPVNCAWGGWSACSGTFNSAIQTRGHSQEASCGGSACTGSSTQSCTILNNASWKDLNGNVITSSQIGDQVYMALGGIGIAGQTINYTVYNEPSGAWQSLLNWLGLGPSEGSLTTNAVYTLTSGTKHKYDAKSNNNNGVTQVNSTNLSVSSTPDNTRPEAIITSPDNNYRTSINYTINFTQRSRDGDDLLNISWNFGDNIIITRTDYSSNFTPTLADTNHNYSIGGDYLVTLTATEKIRGQSDIDTRAINVLAPGMNVKAIISSPAVGVYYGNFVDFYTGNSYVTNCSTTSFTGSTPIGNLYCKDIHAPGKKVIAPSEHYDIILNWTVRNSVGIIEYTQSGSWANNYSQVVNFTRFFASPGAHNAYLEMTYVTV